MPLTLTTALGDLRGLLNEPNAVLWSDEELTELLDQGQKHSAALTLGYTIKLPFTDTDSPGAIFSGLRDYTLASAIGAGGFGITDALKVTDVYLNGNALVEITPKQVNTWNEHAHGSGAPAAFYTFADILTFVPVPNAAFVADYELLIVYAAHPADWTTGDSVLPEGISDMPVWFAATCAWYNQRKYEEAMRGYSQYLSYADAYKPIAAQQAPTTKYELHLEPTRRSAPSRRRQA